jgi:hypothetical protein
LNEGDFEINVDEASHPSHLHPHLTRKI